MHGKPALVRFVANYFNWPARIQKRYPEGGEEVEATQRRLGGDYTDRFDYRSCLPPLFVPPPFLAASRRLVRFRCLSLGFILAPALRHEIAR